LSGLFVGLGSKHYRDIPSLDVSSRPLDSAVPTIVIPHAQASLSLTLIAMLTCLPLWPSVAQALLPLGLRIILTYQLY
jgi:hypothetical protein